MIANDDITLPTPIMKEAASEIERARTRVDAAEEMIGMHQRVIASLQTELRSALTALRDLNAGYPWRELHIDMPTLFANAAKLGVTPEEES